MPQILVTRGVVSRINVDSNLVMRLQIDAAINLGDSGVPVFDKHGHVVGVASAHLRGAGNIGYIIPSKNVDAFMKMCGIGMEVDVEDKYCGLGSLVVRHNNSNSGDWSHHITVKAIIALDLECSRSRAFAHPTRMVKKTQ